MEKIYRIDAYFLVRLERDNKKLLFQNQHREERGQADLAVLRSRDVTVRSRTKLINHVRGTCKTFGVKLPRCSADAFVVRCSKLVPAALYSAVNDVLALIADMTAKIKSYDSTIAAM